jgi:hypothetical protein
VWFIESHKFQLFSFYLLMYSFIWYKRRAVMQINNFTFMLPRIVIDFFLQNQPDAIIIQISFCYKTLHVSGNLFAHHQEFWTAHSALVRFIEVFYDRFQTESGWDSMEFHPDSASAECTVENSWWWAKRLLETCRVLEFHPDSAWKRSSKTCMKIYQCRMYSRELLMMGKEVVRNM